MGGKKKKGRFSSENRKLDYFIQKREQQQKEVKEVEDLTFQALQQRSKPQLRLRK